MTEIDATSFWPYGIPARSVPISGRVLSALVKLTVLLLLTVHGGMLWELGLNYDGITGAAASKIHPATYVTVLAFGLFVLARRNPASLLSKLAVRQPGSVIFFIATMSVLAFIIIGHRPGPAGMVDTFILPILLAWMFAEQNARSVGTLEPMLHLLLTFNALLTLYEFITETQLFPYRFEGELLFDSRPGGLQGHPLSNSVVIGTYVATLMAGGGARLGQLLRPSLIVLQWTALAAAGGRTALVLITTLIGLQLARLAVGLALGRRLSLQGWAACAIVPLTVGAGILALNAAGFFGPLIDRFNDDGGSGKTRVQMFDMFSHLRLRDLLLAPEVGLIESLRPTQGLELGIENPIIRLVLYQGIVATTVLVLGFAFFIREVVRPLRHGCGLPLAFFLLVITSFESLSSKSLLLAQFFVMTTVMFRVDAHEPPDPP
jgi:hypothetical protein